MLPHDRDPRWPPDPIPASFYARGEAPPWASWASWASWAGMVRGLPPRTLLVAGGVAAAGAVLAAWFLPAQPARPASPAADQTETAEYAHELPTQT